MNKIEKYSEILRKQKEKMKNIYKCACYIDKNNLYEKFNVLKQKTVINICDILLVIYYDVSICEIIITCFLSL